MRRVSFFAILKGPALGLARQPRRGNRGEKSDDFDLAIAAGLFQHAAHMGTDGVRRNAAIGGNVVHGFSGGETASNARLGGREIEQGLYEFDGRRLWQGDGSQDKRGGAADKDVARRQADGNDMRDHHRFRAGVADREGSHPAGRHVNGRDRVAQQLIGGSVVQRHAIPRPPMNMACQCFDQRVGGEDLAFFIKHQRREAEGGERFAGDTRPLQLQARR